MQIEIKHRFTGAVLFSLESESIKLCLEAAVKGGAYLSGADLRGADLRGAYLSGADLRGAYLSGAYLSGAYLRDAYLSGAYLSGAYLRGAYLSGAKVDGFLLVGNRPVLQIGPIGSRSDYLLAFLIEQGIRVSAGCFTGTLVEFAKAVKEQHKGSIHGREYAAAIQMIESHAAIWTPAIEKAKVAA